MEKDALEVKVNNALDKLYKEIPSLIENDLCERCIQYRFAKYLEEENFGEGFFVDCEYNRAHLGSVHTKKVTSENGNSIDIVITKRSDNPDDDLVCFELKKWNSKDLKNGIEKDKIKLRTLIGEILPTNIKNNNILKDKQGNYYCFNYKFGIFVLFGKNRESAKIEFCK